MLLETSLRERSVKETLSKVNSYIKKAGISRVADLTDLDPLGIPVYTVIRPLSKSLTTSQGKALTHDLAKISAIMESLEVYYSEEVNPDFYQEKVCFSESFINPNLISKNIVYHDDTKHDWCHVFSLKNNKKYFVPLQFLSIDTTNKSVLVEGTSTMGVASGNTYDEAILHSICECIEKECYNHKKNYLSLDINSELYKKVSKDHEIRLFFYKNDYCVPVIGCHIKSKNPFENQIIFTGYGAHVNKDIALNRAITEAIQSKITTIAGSRDDINKYIYTRISGALENPKERTMFSALETLNTCNIKESLVFLESKISGSNKDILTHVYHSDSLTFLKSLLIDSKVTL